MWTVPCTQCARAVPPSTCVFCSGTGRAGVADTSCIYDPLWGSGGFGFPHPQGATLQIQQKWSCPNCGGNTVRGTVPSGVLTYHCMGTQGSQGPQAARPDQQGCGYWETAYEPRLQGVDPKPNPIRDLDAILKASSANALEGVTHARLLNEDDEDGPVALCNKNDYPLAVMPLAVYRWFLENPGKIPPTGA